MRKRLIFAALAALPLLAQDRITGWSETTPLPFEGVYAARAAAYKGRLLVFAFNGATYAGDVQPDGSIPAWRRTLDVPNVHPQAVPDSWPIPCVIGDYVVVPDSPVSLVGKLGPAGEILSWSNGPGLATPTYVVHATVCSGNRLYVLAGWANGGLLSAVQTATLDGTGNLSAWQSLPPLPYELNDPQATIHDGYLYVFGGEGHYGDLSVSRNVLRAQVLPDGSLGAWTSRGYLKEARPHAMHLKYGNTVHVIGGGVHTYVLDTVESALFSDLGATSLHVDSAPMPVTLTFAGSAVVGRFGYLASGNFGNYAIPRSNRVFYTAFADRTPPVITGMPSQCSLWPVNQKLVPVATVSATASAAALASLAIQITSNETLAAGDVRVTGPELGPKLIELKADRAGSGKGREYRITATARDAAGNEATAKATCVVPHDQGK